MKDLYENDQEFKLFVGMLDGLAFLPLDQIVQGMEHLRNVQPPEDQRLTEYFDATYVSGIPRNVDAAGEIRPFISALRSVKGGTAPSKC